MDKQTGIPWNITQQSKGAKDWFKQHGMKFKFILLSESSATTKVTQCMKHNVWNHLYDIMEKVKI